MPRSLLRFPLIFGVLVSLLVAVIFWKQLPLNTPHYEPLMDRGFYVQIAEGHIDEVIKPFSKRILHPKAAAFLSHLLKVSLDRSFFFIALASLLTLTVGVSFLFKRSVSERYLWIVTPMMVTPYLGLLFYDYYMHDLFYSALLVLFFICLAFNRTWFALPLLFLLFLTREATLLLGLILVLVSAVRKDGRSAAAYCLAVAAGVAVSSYFGKSGLSNRHQLGELLFMVFKVGYNTFANFFGVNLWVSTYSSCEPVLKLDVVKTPLWFSFGAIKSFGLCDINLGQPVHTAFRYLTVFGIGPSVLLTVGRSAKTVWRETESWVLVALIFGTTSYLLGPCLGPGGFRLMGYGWPAFWIAAPVLGARVLRIDWRTGLPLLFCHIVLVWLPEGTEMLRLSVIPERTIILTGAVVFQIVALRILGRLRSNELPVRSPS